MLADVLPCLCCPVCGGDLTGGGRALRCTAGHAFDVARQGYAGLLTGNAQRRHRRHGADGRGARGVPRRRALRPARRARSPNGPRPRPGRGLRAGRRGGYRIPPERRCSTGCPGAVRRGPGHLQARPAPRRRAHPVSARSPGTSGGPCRCVRTRSRCCWTSSHRATAGEFHRVLRPDGDPRRRHARRAPPGGAGRPARACSPSIRARPSGSPTHGRGAVRAGRGVAAGPGAAPDAPEVAALVAMGPSARHTDAAALRSAIGALGEPVPVTAAFDVRIFDARPES